MVRIAHVLLLKGCHDVHAAEDAGPEKDTRQLYPLGIVQKVELQPLN
jgi:hypothetical protein